MEKFRKNTKVETNDMSGPLKITLKTLFGLEGVLQEELNELGYNNTKLLNRAVQVEGTWRDVYFLNLHIRCSISILVEIATFRIKQEQDLYKQAKKINWTNYFTDDKAFAIKGVVLSKLFNHTQFPFLVLKDAIVDVFREELGERPDVDLKRPDVLFDLYINNDWVTVSLNTSGMPLYQRGYREDVGEAPMNEVLAAGLIRLTKWDKQTPLIDPFCGSGTILIEAALYATGIPSTIERKNYAFQNFKNYDKQLWNEIYTTALEKCRNTTKLPVQIIGCDIDPDMVLKAKRNLRKFPFGDHVEIMKGSFEQLERVDSETGIMVTNPPYGERIGQNIPALYARIGDWMKSDLKGFSCWLISSSEEGLKSVGLKPDRKIKLYNGSLECSFRKYSIYAGSKRQKFQVD